MRATPHPPRIATRLLSLATPEWLRAAQVGDLEEEFHQHRPRRGLASARRWYWSQALRSLAPALACRFRGDVWQPPHPRRREKKMETLTQDLRYALRAVRKSPGFTAIAVLTLALGIGVNSAIFSIVNVIVFRELPISNPENVIFIWSDNARHNLNRQFASPADFFAWRDQCESFEGLSAMQPSPFVLTGLKEPMRIEAAQVTDDTFRVWGLGVARGRDFLPGEDKPGADRVAILAHGFWERQFGSDPEVLGMSFLLDGVEHTVVGVADPAIEFGDVARMDLWVPLGMDAASAPRDQRTMMVIGRLKDGVSAAQAQQEVKLVSSRLAKEFPATNRDWAGNVVLFEDGLMNPQTWVILALLGIMVGFVLLIACINVANMILSRASTRQKEVAVRAALGAGRQRILRQLLTENFLIAAAAATLGLVLAQALLTGMQTISSQDPIINAVAIDRNVVVFTLIVMLFTPLVFGLVPSLRASRPDLQQTLRETANAIGGGHRGGRSRGLLVTTQVAMALMLMVTAVLVTRSVINLQQIELGFDEKRLVTAQVSLPEVSYEDDTAVLRFFEELRDNVAALPGVQQAGVVSHRPLVDMPPSVGLAIAGREERQDWDLPRAVRYSVGPGYFESLGLPLLRGRYLDRNDTADALPVAVVSEMALRRLWPNENPLGQRVRFDTGGEGPWIEIVGVVGNVGLMTRQYFDAPQIFLPFEQHPTPQMALMVRTAGDPKAVATSIRQAVWSLDSNQPVDDMRTMTQLRFDGMATSYALVMLFVVFASFALFMSAVGLYGVTSYAVSQRSQEFGIRIALGAGRHEVTRMVLRQSALSVAVGTVLGLGGALLLGRLLQSIVFGVSTADPLTFLAVPVVLALVAVAANLVPARRAARIDPVTSLRAQ